MHYLIWIFFSNIAKLLTLNTRQQETAEKNCLIQGEMWLLFSSQALATEWFLLCFTTCAHQTRIVVFENQYGLHLSRFLSVDRLKFQHIALHCHWVNTASNNFILIDSTVPQSVTLPCQVDWKFLIMINALISYRVNMIHKTCHWVVKICNKVWQ